MNAQMRASPLSPDWYWSPDKFEQERDRIFRRNWVFAGLAQDLENHNDYISFTVAGIPVIVRNMRGQLVGFHNSCSHRRSIIHPQGKGNAPFRCLFHGWSYDDAGVPVGIPDNTNSFGFTMEDRCAMALPKVEVAQCGMLVFVRLESGGPPLKEWLGPFAPKLERMSNTLSNIHSRIDQVWSCNWKYGIEITLEGYHLPFVHPRTFSNQIGELREQEGTNDNGPYGYTECVGLHSVNISPLSTSASEQLTALADGLRLQRHENTGGYDHIHIYPNLMVGMSDGVTLCIEQYNPIAPDRTEAKVWLMAGPSDFQIADSGLYDTKAGKTIATQIMEWTVSVLAEDRMACESVQLGIRHAETSGYLGESEKRVRHLQSTLLKQING
jgi:choline monooxygenase